MKEYDGKVRVVFKNMVVHPQQVMKAHLASCAAGKQGKFIEFHKAFWEKGYKPYQDQREMSFLGEENVHKVAGEIGLDVDEAEGRHGRAMPAVHRGRRGRAAEVPGQRDAGVLHQR